MTLILLLALSTAPGADFPDLIIPPARVGVVPILSPAPSGLPPAVEQPGGSMLVPPLRARYVAAQVSALYRLPGLSQKALDIAVDAERDACDIRVLDARAEMPTWTDRLRSGVLWAIGGAVLGGALVAYLTR